VVVVVVGGFGIDGLVMGKGIWSVKSQCHLCPKILLWNTWRKKTKGQMFFIHFTELSCSKLNFDI